MEGKKQCLIEKREKTIRITLLYGILSHDQALRGGGGLDQVGSLPRFEVSCQYLINDLNQVSSVSLLITCLRALAKDFCLTGRPAF